MIYIAVNHTRSRDGAKADCVEHHNFWAFPGVIKEGKSSGSDNLQAQFSKKARHYKVFEQVVK